MKRNLRILIAAISLFASFSLYAQDGNNPGNKVMASEEDKRVVAQAISNLEFDFGKSRIRSKSFSDLNGLADWLKSREFTLKIAGHTDNVGSDAFNLNLSKNRANSVKRYLVQKGVNSSLVDPAGFGEAEPLASNNSPAGRQKNRRVEFTLY